MVNAEKFYKKLIDRLSIKVREALSEQDKAFHRETEVIELLHDKTMPYEDYIKLQKELETLANSFTENARILKITQDKNF